NIFAAKLGPTGDYVYSVAFGDEVYLQGVNAVAADGDGAAFIVGGFASTVDFGVAGSFTATSVDGFVAKLDGSGAAEFATVLGGSGTQVAKAVAIDAAGNAVVVGDWTG